jgi:proteic killer suppression protein
MIHGGLSASCADKLRKMIVYLEVLDEVDELRRVPVWKAHLLAGGRSGTWSLHVTRNWRVTFWTDNAQREICDVNFEDYH